MKGNKVYIMFMLLIDLLVAMVKLFQQKVAHDDVKQEFAKEHKNQQNIDTYISIQSYQEG